MTPEIEGFAASIGLEIAATNRYSSLLLLQLFAGSKSGMMHPSRVITEINTLEGNGKKSVLKPPIQNKYPPLKGLWHKHFQQDGISALSRTVKKGLNNYGMPLVKERVLESERSGIKRLITVEDVPSIVNDIIQGNLTRLGNDQKITGEWLIFAKYNNENYYLCLATHDESTHQEVRNQIDAVCCVEFPFLVQLLQDAV